MADSNTPSGDQNKADAAKQADAVKSADAAKNADATKAAPDAGKQTPPADLATVSDKPSTVGTAPASAARVPATSQPIVGQEAASASPTGLLANAADRYPPGHPNVRVVGADGTPKNVVDKDNNDILQVHPVDATTKGLLVPTSTGPTVDAVTVHPAAVEAHTDRLHVIAGEFVNAVRGFAHDVAPDSQLGKLIAFVRNEFGVEKPKVVS